MTSFTRIVVPTDFSETARMAFESAVELACESHAELHVCHAMEYVALMVSPNEVALPEDFIEQTRVAAQNRLTLVVEEAKSAGLVCEGHLLSDRADPGISLLAEQLDADLIVMGTGDPHPLRSMFLSSVVERTVRHAPCSVLTIKGPHPPHH